MPVAALATVITWWLASGVAHAATPPSNSGLPTISGVAQQGVRLTANPGTWSGDSPISYTYKWSDGQTGSTDTPSAADVGQLVSVTVTASNAAGKASATSARVGPVLPPPTPAASQPTTTALLASPAAAVTNEGVTLIATVTSSAHSSTALWGAVTFEDGGATISGCGNMAVTPDGQSATVACSTSFAASTARLTATFTPTAGSVLKGSVSPADSFTVGPDSTSTALDVSSSVSVGAGTTYTASVAPPAARPGPIEPTGSIEFLDGGQPISSCSSQPLIQGVASCAVTYTAAGAHQVSARYVGDANFTASSSPTEQVNAAFDLSPVLGRIAVTMQWGFYFTPAYTQVRNLAVNGVLSGATVLVQCHGRGCPFAHRATLLTSRVRCGKKARMCFTGGSFLITPGFGSRQLAVGARVTVAITRPNWVGKYYGFTIRSRRAPRIRIACLAPGGSVPGQGC